MRSAVTAMPPDVHRRFAAICGRLGSDHEGERAAAALLATRILRDHGLTWADAVGAGGAAANVISLHDGGGGWTEPQTMNDVLEVLLAHQDLFSDWERTFLASVVRQAHYRKLSRRQLEIVERMLSMARIYARAGARATDTRPTSQGRTKR